MYQLADVLKILLDPKTIKSTCFMCYKQGDEMMSLFEYLHIENQWFNVSLSFKSLIKYIFPIKDTILLQACQLCADTFLKFYIQIRQKEFIERYLIKLINEININICKENLIGPLFIETPNHTSILEYQDTDKRNNQNIDMIHESSSKRLSKDFNATGPYIDKVNKKIKKRKRKSYNCNICDYKTKCKTTLEGHKNSKHLQQKPHFCTKCNKCFYSKNNLNEHYKTHEKFSEIICEICGEKFRHNKTLKDHLKLHLNEKLYECHVCNLKFVNQSRVNTHMKQKHGEKKEFCVFCGKKFVFKKDVLRHVKLVHKREDNIQTCVNQNIVENTIMS